MSPYMPIRTRETAVVDTITDLRREVASLSALTSGQIAGTISRLKATIDAMPVPVGAHQDYTDWASTTAGQPLASMRVPVPDGKRQAQVIACTSGTVTSDGVHANNPYLRLRIGTSKSGYLIKSNQGMNTWSFIGMYTATVDTTPAGRLQVDLLLDSGTVYKGGDYIHYGALDVMVLFTD